MSHPLFTDDELDENAGVSLAVHKIVLELNFSIDLIGPD